MRNVLTFQSSKYMRWNQMSMRREFGFILHSDNTMIDVASSIERLGVGRWDLTKLTADHVCVIPFVRLVRVWHVILAKVRLLKSFASRPDRLVPCQ